MKKIKLLETEKRLLEAEEERISSTTYQSQADKIDYGYDFKKTRKAIGDINRQIRKLKHMLNYSNATTLVPGFSMTLGECLVYMAQLNNEKRILERFVAREKTERNSTFNGVIEYTVLSYDKEECRTELNRVQETIAELQMAIDRTNLTNLIEVA